MFQFLFYTFSPVCAVDSGVDFAMDEDEEYNWGYIIIVSVF